MQRIKQPIEKRISYCASQKQVEEVSQLLNTLKYDWGEFDVLAVFTYVIVVHSTYKSTISSLSNPDLTVTEITKKIKGINSKRHYIQALLKLDSFHKLSPKFKDEVDQVKSYYLSPEYYLTVFQGLYRLFSDNRQFLPTTFHVMYMILLEINFNNENDQAFDQAIVISILFKFFFTELFAVQIVDPNVQSLYQQMLDGLTEGKIELQTRQHYQKKAKKILEKAFQSLKTIPYRQIFLFDHKRLLQIAQRMQQSLKEDIKHNSSALSQINRCSIYNCPKLPQHQENTSSSDAATAFIF